MPESHFRSAIASLIRRETQQLRDTLGDKLPDLPEFAEMADASDALADALELSDTDLARAIAAYGDTYLRLRASMLDRIERSRSETSRRSAATPHKALTDMG